MENKRNDDPALIEITSNGNLDLTNKIEKDEEVYKTPEQTVKQPKVISSLLRNDQSDYMNKAGNTSPEDQDRGGKRSNEGTYYINNITNNIVVDQKHKEQAGENTLSGSGNGPVHRGPQDTQEKCCTCHLKHLDKNDPRYPMSFQRNFPNVQGMPNLAHFPPYFLQMMEWYHMEMMKQYHVQGRGFGFPPGAPQSRPSAANCSCSSEDLQNPNHQCHCGAKQGPYPGPSMQPLFAMQPKMNRSGYPGGYDHSQETAEGMDKNNFEKLSFVSPLQTSRKQWRDFDCQAGEKGDTSAPRPFNLQSSTKRRPIDSVKQFSF